MIAFVFMFRMLMISTLHDLACNSIQYTCNTKIKLICTVSLSLFADPERILRRFYVFAEEPRKSIITAIEPCSPVFKEAQPRPS